MKIKLKFGAILLLLSMIFSNNIIYALIYVICATVHELGHLCAAKLLKIKISELSFDIGGAKIIPAGQISSYKKDFLLCAAGPAASGILALAAIFVCRVGISPYSIINSDTTDANQILSAIAVFSAVQAIINLLPVEGFDGAKMLNATVIYIFGEKVGDAISSIIAFTFALLLWMASVYLLIKVGAGLSLFSFSLCMFLKLFDEKD